MDACRYAHNIIYFHPLVTMKYCFNFLVAATCASAVLGFLHEGGQLAAASQLRQVRNSAGVSSITQLLTNRYKAAAAMPPMMASATTAGGQEEWTPKRLHNTNWFRSAAILIAITLMGATQSSPIARLPIKAAAILHLLSFSTWFGTMIYTTFIFGITAFKNLPRQTFGKLQAKLFPKYFSLGSICLVLQVGYSRDTLPNNCHYVTIS